MELAAALAGELPSAATYGPIPAGVDCPAGGRGVTLQSNDGTITIVVVPRDTDLSSPQLPPGAVRFDADTPDGRGVALISQPWPWMTDAPFGAELPGVLDRLKSKV